MKSNYDYTASVTDMMTDKKWDTLAIRRTDARLILFFKVVHGLVDVSAEDLVPGTLLPADSRTRANHKHKYRQLTATTAAYNNSFFPRTISHWNKLNFDQKHKDLDLYQFKRQLLSSHLAAQI